jgi:hypothetical protein
MFVAYMSVFDTNTVVEVRPQNRYDVSTVARKKRKNNKLKTVFFKRTKARKKRSRGRARLAKVYRKKIRSFVLIILALAAVSVGLYFGVNYILNLKNSPIIKDQDYIGLENDDFVVGLSEVPAYPSSEFMFKQDIDTDLVQDFLADGKSAYIIYSDDDWSDISDFYKQKLKSSGWVHVLSVSRNDEERKFGEYWVKYDKSESGENLQSGVGLRIFTKMHDIWYEKISLQEAKNGLAEEVAQEQELDMMLAMNSSNQLPEEFPWSLKFASNWDAEISKSSLLEIEKATLKNLDDEGSLEITPVDFANKQELVDLGEEKIEEVNSHRDSEDRFEVSEPKEVTVDDIDAVRFDLESEDNNGAVCLVSNPKNDVVYMISTFSGEIAFFNYVVENIEVNN